MSGWSRFGALPLAALALLVSPGAQGARPMTTDDARVVDPKSCQLESWVRRNRDSTEYWALPACNFWTSTEFTLGGAIGSDPQGTRTTDGVVQVKHVYRPLSPDGWGSGVAAGYVSHPALETGSNVLGDAYGYLLNSFAFGGERLFVHTNLGAIHERATRENRVIWGVGIEAQLWARGYLVAETYGRDVGRPWYQAGLRVWLVPDRVQVDATIGGRAEAGTNERWISVGLRLLSPPFLR